VNLQRPELIGYADPWCAAAGQCVRFMVSTDVPEYEATLVRLVHGDENPDGPGFKEEVIHTSVTGRHKGRKQTAFCGSYVVVADSPKFSRLTSLTLQAWIYPTKPRSRNAQGIVSKWSPRQEAGFGILLGPEGDLQLWIGGGPGEGYQLSTNSPLKAEHWYFIAATLDTQARRACLVQHPVESVGLGETDAVVEVDVPAGTPAASSSPLLIAAISGETRDDERFVVAGLYNGKIDRPRLFARALDAAQISALRDGVEPREVDGEHLLAAWDFAADPATDRITDASSNQLHGVAVNVPTRAVTGYNWTGNELHFERAPAEYGAIHFHDGDLEDAGWSADFELELDGDLRSGIYAMPLTADGAEDHIPFFVRPGKGARPATIAVLVPTMTYLAYANQAVAEGMEQHTSGIGDRELVLDPLDRYVEAHPELGRSMYDRHSDGSGVAYSSALRPIVGLRPKYRYWINGGPRHLAADLYLLDWLEHRGFVCDVITDHDLHAQGRRLLQPYRTVITGTHPEYCTGHMLSTLQSYTSTGGRLMYLGGNGFYWVTSVDPNKPHLIELRRGMSGSRDWSSAPGECHHSTTGEPGGLWRHRGRPPNAIAGVGFTAMGWDGARGYTRRQGSFDPRASFIFAGVGEDETIGNFGLILNGAAGDEIDRFDHALGTPSHALLLASSSGHSPMTFPVLEDQLQINSKLSSQSVDIRADMVYFETPNNGAVFATGSINWCASLSHNRYDNNVSRITENVLRKFLDRQ
jgi:N,N-dimethylformamidase